MNEDQIRARDAEALLANPVFSMAMARLNDSLDMKILGMDIVNKEQCAKAIQAKQLLKALEREIHRFIVDGEVADLLEESEADNIVKPRQFER